MTGRRMASTSCTKSAPKRASGAAGVGLGASPISARRVAAATVTAAPAPRTSLEGQRCSHTGRTRSAPRRLGGAGSRCAWDRRLPARRRGTAPSPPPAKGSARHSEQPAVLHRSQAARQCGCEGYACLGLPALPCRCTRPACRLPSGPRGRWAGPMGPCPFVAPTPRDRCVVTA